MLKRFAIQNCSPKSTPLPPGLVLSSDDCPNTPEEHKEMNKTPYQEALGSLMWLQVATQPDLSYTVGLLFRFAYNPGQTHWNTIKHALVYVKGTTHYGITYKGNTDLNHIGYVDSDFAGCQDTCCSTEGNIFLVAGEPVFWESKRQETIALLTVEAEYMAFSRATTQALWITKYLHEVGVMETLDSTELFMEDQTWLDYL